MLKLTIHASARLLIDSRGGNGEFFGGIYVGRHSGRRPYGKSQRRKMQIRSGGWIENGGLRLGGSDGKNAG